MSVTRDLYNNLTVVSADFPANRTGTLTGTGVDRAGYESSNIVFHVGDSADTLSGSVYWTLTVEESDDDVTYTPVAATDFLGGVSSVVIDAPAEDSAAFKFGIKAGKRYLRGVATATGTHTNGTIIGIIAELGNPNFAPVA